ncbi:ABC transporter substrate-binding protein [Allocoleopsis sp.]|uniref:ABC transporter substrate-binding protein n=1 Tax=Allocoleopsis sp. TaxID=3088169 RepID=UPI002FD422D7
MAVVGEKAQTFAQQAGNFWFHIHQWCVLGICLLLLGGCQLQGHPDKAGVLQLTLWHGVNPPHNRDVLQELVERFNQEHPDIQVKSLYVGQEDQQIPKILASVVGNVPPDMLWFNPTLTGQLVELNAIRPLDEFLAASSVKDEIDPALFESMQFLGHNWSVPFGTNNAGIFYRPSLFEAAGITQLPKTWEELREVAKTLTCDLDGDERVDQHGILLPLGKGEWTVFMWLPFMWSGGGELVGESMGSDSLLKFSNGVQNFPYSPTPGGGVNLVNQGAIAALQFWHDLIEDGSAALSVPERGYEMDGFLAGKVAMQFSGPWTLGQLQATGVDFGVFPMPSAARQATVIGGENLFLFKTNREREQAAFRFAEYVMGEEFQTQWAIGTGYLPVNLKARQSKAYQAFVEQQSTVKVFLKQAEFGRSRPLLKDYPRISENLGRAIEAVLLSKNSPREALEKAQQRLDLIFR